MIKSGICKSWNYAHDSELYSLTSFLKIANRLSRHLRILQTDFTSVPNFTSHNRNAFLGTISSQYADVYAVTLPQIDALLGQLQAKPGKFARRRLQETAPYDAEHGRSKIGFYGVINYHSQFSLNLAIRGVIPIVGLNLCV